MKNFVFKLFVTSLFISLISCNDYLEPVAVTNLLTVEQATEYYTYSRERVASIYSSLMTEFTRINLALLDCASDDAEFTLEASNVQNFNRGSWNQYNNPDDVWGLLYRNIRKANQYLANSDNIDLDLYKYDPLQQEVYVSYSEEIKRWNFEVRFLRAYSYFELIKRYGGVPIVKEFALTDDFENISRNSLADCIQYVVDECDAIVDGLPARYDATNLGRITKVAVLSLKSRMLLYAASELFNNPSWASGYSNIELISLSGNSRQERWLAAAEAAKTAIDEAERNGYVLGTNYRDLFGENTHSNNEVVFFRRDPTSNNFEIENVSIGFNRGRSGTGPSQNLVDDYEMNDGSRFDWNNPVHAANPFANRDPRLSLTIVTNNSTFKGRVMQCWDGGVDGPPIVRTSKTGYYLKKYVNENLNLESNQTSTHSWVIFRLAELYLNYAEALNEVDPENSDIKIYVDKVRQRNGVNMPGLSSDLNQAEMREKIYNERRIEFAFEGHRLWDVRRWMMATSVLATPIKGLKITRISDNQFNYSVQDIESRVFLPKMYFYPIPQNDMYISGNLKQNPLW